MILIHSLLLRWSFGACLMDVWWIQMIWFNLIHIINCRFVFDIKFENHNLELSRKNKNSLVFKHWQWFTSHDCRNIMNNLCFFWAMLVYYRASYSTQRALACSWRSVHPQWAGITQTYLLPFTLLPFQPFDITSWSLSVGEHCHKISLHNLWSFYITDLNPQISTLWLQNHITSYKIITTSGSCDQHDQPSWSDSVTSWSLTPPQKKCENDGELEQNTKKMMTQPTKLGKMG